MRVVFLFSFVIYGTVFSSCTMRMPEPWPASFQSISLNGKDHAKSFILYRDIVAGGELVITMGPAPSETWGRSKGSRPSSAIVD